MRKRILSVLLCLCVLAGSFSFFIVPAGAVLPLGIAESALVSYMSSIGYKMYTDPSVEAAGQSILSGISSLYSDFISTATLTEFALQTLIDSNLVYLDSQNNFVVTKAAADVFQQFGEWLQEEYQIPDNTDTPTEVVAPESDGMYQTPNGAVFQYYAFTNTPANTNSLGNFKLGSVVGLYPPYNSDTYLGSDNLSGFYITHYKTASSDYICYFSSSTGNVNSYSFYYNRWNRLDNLGPSTTLNSFVMSNNDLSKYRDIVVTEIDPSGYTVSDLVAKPLASGLGLSIAKTVVDQAAKAKDDDAVVLGVGAQAGMTAQDIVDIVSQAVLDRTLVPDVSITAVAVIDTPVQQFPDQDDLGLPKLGNALIRRFPFCIPFDLVDTWQAIVHAPVPPVMTIDIIPASVKAKVGVTADTSFELNLASPAFSTLLFIIRWGCIISFCLALERLTKRFIWTTGG